MEQLARYWDHLSTLILTCYDISDPLFHSAEPLAAAQRFFTQSLHLISHSSFSRTPLLCLNVACAHSHRHTLGGEKKIKITPIDIVKSALTLSVCLCQVEPSVQGLSRERVGAENPQPQQDKRTPPISSPHPLAHSFGLTPSSIMQDPRMQSIR